MHTGIIVQCRMSSARLPGKVLHEVRGKPMLQYTLEGLARCRGGTLVVSTSEREEDKAIIRFCKAFGVPFHCGPLENVALRFARTVEHFGFDNFVRVCGDSPLLDYRLVDKAMAIFEERNVRMVSNVVRRTFPKGQSVEMLDARYFLDHVTKILSPTEQEHVTSHFYARQNPVELEAFESGGAWGEVRQSVDTPEDMRRFAELVARMKRPHWEYTYKDILAMQGYLVNT